MQRARRRSRSSLGRAGNYAAPALRGRHRRPGARRAAAAGAGAGAPRSRPRCCSSSSSGRRSTTTRAEELLAADGLDFCAPPPALGAPLPPAPAHRARGEDPHREGVTGRARLGAAVRASTTSAIAVELPDAASRSSLEQARWRSSARPTASVRRDAAEAVTAALEPGPAHARLRLQHAAGRQGDRRPAAPLPELARQPQPGQRGERRVGAGARRRGASAATSIPQRWYRLKARLLGIDRLADYDRMAAVTADDERGRAGREAQGARARRLRGVLAASWAASRGASSTSAGSTRRSRPGKRGGRVLRLHRAVACTRTCCSTTRTGAATCSRSPTSSATACTPRSAAQQGDLPPEHAADAGRDGVGVRRDGRPSAACSSRPPTPEARLALLAESIEGAIATVFRQTAMNRFEDRVHTTRRERGRAVGRALRRAVGRDPGRAARRRASR